MSNLPITQSSTMTDPFTIERFLPHVGEVFQVVVDESHELRIVLTEIARLGGSGWDGRLREPFSLVFHAQPGAFIPQQIYRVEHAELDPFDCFLVPIGPDASGMRFEAIFT
jgi:hypothetical protein